jgi:hypothetical protein
LSVEIALALLDSLYIFYFPIAWVL